MAIRGAGPKQVPPQTVQQAEKTQQQEPVPAQQDVQPAPADLEQRIGLGTDQQVIGGFAREQQGQPTPAAQQQKGVLNLLNTQQVGGAKAQLWQPTDTPGNLVNDATWFAERTHMNHVHGRPSDEEIGKHINDLSHALQAGQLTPKQQQTALAARSNLLLQAASFESRSLEPFKGQLLSADGQAMVQADPAALHQRGLADVEQLAQLVDQHGTDSLDWQTVGQVIEGLSADGVLTDQELQRFEALEREVMQARGNTQSVDYYQSGIGNQICLPQGSPAQTQAGLKAAVQYKKELADIDALGRQDPTAAGEQLKALAQQLHQEVGALEKAQARGEPHPQGLVAAQVLDDLMRGTDWPGRKAASQKIGGVEQQLPEGARQQIDRTILEGADPRHLALYGMQLESMMYRNRDNAQIREQAAQTLLDGFSQAETFPAAWHVEAMATVLRECGPEKAEQLYPVFADKVRQQVRAQPHARQDYVQSLDRRFLGDSYFGNQPEMSPAMAQSLAQLRAELAQQE